MVVARGDEQKRSVPKFADVFFLYVATQRFCVCLVYFFPFILFFSALFGLFCVLLFWYVLVCWFVGLFVDLFWYIGVCSVHFLVCFGFHSVTQNLKSRKKIRCPNVGVSFNGGTPISFKIIFRRKTPWVCWGLPRP